MGGGVDTDVGWDGAGTGWDGAGAGLGIEVGPSVIIVAWQPANMMLATRKQANSKETGIDYRQTAAWRGKVWVQMPRASGYALFDEVEHLLGKLNSTAGVSLLEQVDRHCPARQKVGVTGDVVPLVEQDGVRLHGVELRVE